MRIEPADQNGGTRAAPATTWTPDLDAGARAVAGRPEHGRRGCPVPANWSISGCIQHRAPSTSDQIATAASSCSRDAQVASDEPDEPGDEHERRPGRRT